MTDKNPKTIDRYPTLKEVNAADRYQLCLWHRFLVVPRTAKGLAITNTIYDRYVAAGGFTPEISKSIGH